jgi:tRNA modification GTPase
VFSTADTIVAIATAPGRGAIGIVRLSGPDAAAIARAITTRRADFVPRRAVLTRVLGAGPAASGGPAGTPERAPAIDHAVVTYFAAPASYTGDDVIELSVHGSPFVLNSVVSAALAAGARAAAPGEFTLRAFLNGRVDLTQAEAVADLVDAATPLQAQAAFDQLQGTLTRRIADIDAALFDLAARLEACVDFPEEGYHFIEPGQVASAIDRVADQSRALLADARRGRLVREGLQIAIAGKPNVGKSSLFNAIVGTARAIVTDVPGTTRDLVTETVDLEGLRVTLVDTAGLRLTDDPVEREGVSRSGSAVRVADLVLVVCDASRPWDEDDERVIAQTTESKRLIVANKRDLPSVWDRPDAVQVSATTGCGVAKLRDAICKALDVDLQAERPAVTNARHIGLLARALAALDRARRATEMNGRSLSEEFVLDDLQEARTALEEIAGRRSPDDLLEHIFARFCIGK